jgi:sugar O-acyltransferase (sialic acid O-acetyltransferase NeuD family)
MQGPPRLLVVGAGGHARVVLDAFRRAGVHEIVGLLDNKSQQGDRHGFRILGSPEDIARIVEQFGITAMFIAIGDNWSRAVATTAMTSAVATLGLPSVAHPSAVIADDVEVGGGSALLAGSVVGPGTHIGRGVIVNTNASVDHECILYEYSSVSPGATLAGGVQVGRYSVVGLGACVIEHCRIGEHAVVGAGAVVTHDVPANVVVYGNPARVVRQREAGTPYLRSPRR